MNQALLDKQRYTLSEAESLLRKQHDDEGEITQVLIMYCMTSEHSEVQRKGLEFLYMHELYQELQALIHINAARSEKENKQWATVYQIKMNRRYKTEKTRALLDSILLISTDDPELTCIIEFTKMNLYYDLKQYGRVGDFLAKQNALFSRVYDPMFLEFLQIRLYQCLFIYYWKRNEIIMARKYAYRALTYPIQPRMQTSLHINLGLTYSFETYEQGMSHFTKAIEIAETYGLSRMLYILHHHNIPFLSAHFKRTDGIYTESIGERAHLHIAVGNNKRAIELLKQTDLNNPFKMYYMGLAKQKESYLIRSYDCFIERKSNFFFARLPLLALHNLS